MTNTISSATKRDRKLQIALGVCVLTGIVLVVSTLVPKQIGRQLTSTGLLSIAMTFIGSALVYIALLPEDTKATADLTEGVSR